MTFDVQKKLSLLFIPIYLLLISLPFVLNIWTVYNSPILLLVFNTIFLGVIPLYVSYIAYKSFMGSGSTGVLLQGTGMLLLGLGAITAGFVGLFPDSMNLVIGIHNTNFCIAAFLQFIGIFIPLSGSIPKKHLSDRELIFLLYSGSVVFTILFSFALFFGVFPPFYVQGSGYTALRLLVITDAIGFFIFTAVILLWTYFRKREDFFFWYSIGLALMAMGLISVIFSPVLGSPLSWIGRSGQFLGAIYILIAFIALNRSAKKTGVPLDTMLSRFFGESEASYKTLVESATDAIVVFDSSYRVIVWNPAAEKMFGYSQIEAIGSSFLTLVIPDEYLDIIRRFSETDQTLKKSTEIVTRRKDGGTLPVEMTSSRHSVAGVSIITCIIRDLTERKKAEEELLLKNYVFQSSIAANAIADERGYVTHVNDAYTRMWGYERNDESIGKTINVFFYVEQDAESVLQSLNTVGQWEGDFLAKRKDGSTFTSRCLATVVRDMTGKQIGYQFAHLNVTEERNIQVSLRESEERFRVIFERSTVGKSLTAPNGKLLKINPSFATMLGYTIEEMQELDFAHITYPEDIAESKECVRSLLENEKTSYRMEKRYLHKTGGLIWTDVSTTLLKNGEGEPLYFITSIIDISKQKQAEQDLKKYSENLEEMINERTRELEDAQDQLLRKEKLAVLGKLAGGVGHELRNPLGAIKNAAYFINMALENPEPDVKEMVEIINKEVGRSEDIISSLLDFARPKSLTLRKGSVNSIILEALRRNPAPKSISVIENLEESLPEIYMDSDKLLQVFSNIISNALQSIHEEKGILTITSMQPRPGWVAVSIADTGVGISEKNKEKLYEPLFTTKIKGIGLGMVVTKTIVETHGGRIDFLSEEGKGTTFTVSLPNTGRKGE